VTGKLVFVNRYFHPDQSATSQLLTDLTRGLAARGFDVHVVCSRQLYDDPSARLPSREALCGVQVHRVVTTRFGRTGLWGRAMDYASFYVSCAAELLRCVGRNDVLVAKTDPPLLSFVAAPIAKLKRAALVNWQQDVFPEVAAVLGANPFPAWLCHVLGRLRDDTLRVAHRNVVISERMSEYFVSRGIPAASIRRIENWTDDDAVRVKPTAASKLRAQLELAGRFVVGYSGNLGRAHEFETLLSAAEALRDDPTFVFLMVGGGAKMVELENAVRVRKLQNFRFLPYQPRESLEDSLAAADVHLVSLRPALEGLILPSKVYGILAAGRPLLFIGDPDGDVGRLVERADCGRVIGVGDGAALTRVLRSLNEDPIEVLRMGANAREVLRREYSAQSAFERWARLLDEVGQPRDL